MTATTGLLLGLCATLLLAAPGGILPRAPGPGVPGRLPVGGPSAVSVWVPAPATRPSWHNVTNTSTSGAEVPLPLYNVGATYDATMGAAIEFGGLGVNPNYDSDVTWVLRNGTWTGTLPSPGHPAPPASFGGVLTYDPALSGDLLYGGATIGSTYYGDNQTWLYRDGQWTNLTANLSGPNPGHWTYGAMAYDPALTSVVLFGGIVWTHDSTYYTNATWVFNGTAWTNLSARVGGHFARLCCALPALDYDPNVGGMLLVLPTDGATARTEVFRNDTWTILNESVAPAARVAAELVFDAAENRSILFGGANPAQTVVLNDTWAFANGSWVEVDAGSASGPPGRMYANAWYDPVVGQVVLTRGYNPNHTPFTDLWAWGAPLVPSVRVSVNASVVEVGDTVSFQASPSAPGDPYLINCTWWSGATPLGPGVVLNQTERAVRNVSVFADCWSLFGPGNQSANTANVTVLSDLAVRLNVTTQDLEAGVPIAFRASASGGLGPYRYVWTVGRDHNLTGAELNYTYPAPGDYAVSVSAHDALNATASARADVNVTAGVTVALVPENPSCDVGWPGQFTAVPDDGIGPYSYAWTVENISVPDSGSELNESFGTPGPYAIGVAVEDAAGGVDTTSLTETVVPGPQVTLTVDPNRTDVGAAVDLSGSVSGGVGPITFSWNLGDGTGAHGTALAHHYATAGTYSVVLNATDATGDPANATATIEVAPPPTVAIVVNTTTWTVGAPVFLRAVAENGTPPYVYNWTLGGGQTSTAATALPTYSAAGNYRVSVTLTDGIGLASTRSISLTLVNATTMPAGHTNRTAGPTPAWLLVALGLAATAAVLGAAAWLVRRRRTRGD